MCLYLKNANRIVKMPRHTRAIPRKEEYPFDSGSGCLPNIKEISLIKRVNFTTTNPNAIIPTLVLTHARNVLSLAK
jgi:hypothetical protein